jgi:hypothetical protein
LRDALAWSRTFFVPAVPQALQCDQASRLLPHAFVRNMFILRYIAGVLAQTEAE